ncbi:centromere protein J isoform X2 [Hydra vulgaris]|uniref:centromere protein J isoform X2 n=1 Tax=Hydra vulgaris TaxID=6087 RepID=UPI001F5F20B0|nr:centromere protein J isoform X2 [Hydra vulgaris]
MNKVNLLEKLRTLQQWQIQQQQNFSSNHSNKIVLNCDQQDVSRSCSNTLNQQLIKNDSKSFHERVNTNISNQFFKNNPLDSKSDPSKDELCRNDFASSEHFLADLNSTSTPSKNVFSFPVSSKNFGSDSEDGLSDFNINDEDFKLDGVEPINDYTPYDADKITVVEQVKNSDEIKDEIPIKAGCKDHEILFEEDRERASFVMKPQTVKTKFNFLKRGEGLKRFHKENALNRNKKIHVQINNQNKNDLPNKNIKTVGLPLKLKEPIQDVKTVGLPLKLKEPIQDVKTVGLPLKLKEPIQDVKTVGLPLKLQDVKNKDSSRDSQDTNLLSVNNHSLFKENTTVSVSVNKLEKTGLDKAPFLQIVSHARILEANNSESNIYHNYLDLNSDKILEELLAFEELEEAAENLSLSSNCSVVQRLLGKHKFKKGEFSIIKNNAEVVSSSCEIGHKHEIQPSLHNSHERLSLHNSQEIHPLEFFDEESWSDASKISENLNETLVDDNLIENSIKPKRFVCKRKETRNDIESNIEERYVSKHKETKIEEIDQFEKTSDEIQPHFQNISDVVKLKLETLEKEITKFRVENEKLSKLRQERETDLSTLRKQLNDFEKEKLEETNRFEQYKIGEIKKLKAERKAFENYQKINKEVPNKVEREEIKELNEQISCLKEEIKFKEERWNAAAIRFRSKISQLEEENTSLQKQIIMLEQERLQRIKKNEKKEKVVTFAPNSIIDTEQQCFMEKHVVKNPKYEIEDPIKERESVCAKNDQTIAMTPLLVSNHQVIRGKQIKHTDGKIESVMADGSRIIKFANGTEKVVSADEKTISIKFFNGDVKRVLPDNRMVYYYAESQTTHTTFANGLEVLEFPNNQVEKRFPDGQIEITFPDQTVKKIMSNGCEETLFADGTVQRTEINGQTVIVFPNGQRETHTMNYKKREYPNGTVKTIYEDGRQETKYSNGRLRVKDKQGNLLIDTGETD